MENEESENLSLPDKEGVINSGRGVDKLYIKSNQTGITTALQGPPKLVPRGKKWKTYKILFVFKRPSRLPGPEKKFLFLLISSRELYQFKVSTVLLISLRL